ncbi:hypothetical protein BK784_00020 [Bacillus thuringiensis serovar medellin]|uniref:Uncharacterized protein n=1 Tax=Bacillus thuringiensis subsp. medellin TaxID=79672 RepID=A0A9X6N8N6_BACTV|nr:hypothetical protein [Bacillus thuringiensis]OUC04086.1 hypothetical protein BK784_00020 [Bacillus thuringiensis serovar medellin]
MQKRQFLNLNEGDCIYVYSEGNLEAQGRYVCVVEDKNELFLCWRKNNGNEVYTNMNGISVETMNENTAYLQNTRETCERGYNDTYDQNTSVMYNKSYNNYDQNMENTYQPSYDNYNQDYHNDYKHNGNYNQNSGCTCNQGYNGNYPK